jgi:GNAT superfamily N-acetyltransferase
VDNEFSTGVGGHPYRGHMTAEAISTRSIAEVPWIDAERVFGTRGDPSRCWCQFYKLSNKDWWAAGGEGCSARLKDQARANSPTPGLIAYLDSEPVGWVAVEPRTNYPTALRGVMVTGGSSEPVDDASVWAIVCFVVRVGFRRRGVADALVTAAVDHARTSGARLVEGYPVDVAEKGKTSSAELYHGTITLFSRAGFEVVATPRPGRALMQLRL